MIQDRQTRPANNPILSNDQPGALSDQYRQVRGLTEQLCEPLEKEDYVVQSMPDASPAKWHLAHTSWFFETFLLTPHCRGYRPFHPEYGFLFNSYYNAVGERIARASRGLLTRPTVDEVYRYRCAVDEEVLDLLDKVDDAKLETLAPLVVLGLNHEQQHQELLLTDLKHAFGWNPLRPAYREPDQAFPRASVPTLSWTSYPAGLRWIGHEGKDFAFDNEKPRHRVFVEAHALASRLVTAGEYLAFIEDGGYHRPEWWLSDGWYARSTHQWEAPLYWEKRKDRWWLMTLHGMRELTHAEPVCHLSYYEADAYAHWAGARLPTEAEWQTAAETHPVKGNFLEDGHLHPTPVGAGQTSRQFFGDVWEWTASPYVSYPGYRSPTGALGEYNGKFMCNQMVLHGGSCVTPQSHIRPSYRNFFPPEARWQFSGFRLAKDA